jgi:hypothetical protein
VPGGTFVHVSAGDVCAPACVNRSGITVPSANAVVVNRIAAGAGGF